MTTGTCHVTVKFDFKTPSESISPDVYTPEIRSVIKSICEMYSADFSLSVKKYMGMIDDAIKNDNLMVLECLYQGIYYHDRNNPNYDFDLILAAEFSQLKTFQHILYAYHNYASVFKMKKISVSKLIMEAKKNPHRDVLAFIETLPFGKIRTE